MRSRVRSYVLAAALLAGSVAYALGDDQGNPQDAWQRYQVLIERNIFSRRRGRAPERPLRAAPLPPPRPERYIVLTGVVEQGEQHIAFLEDIRAATVIKVQIGDSVLQGQVKKITLDGIEYAKDGSIAAIEIGQNLEGDGGTTMSATGAEPAGAETGTTASALAPAGGAAEAAVLEEMRKRRQKELGR